MKDSTAVVAPEETALAKKSGFFFNFDPKDLEQALEVCKVIADSDVVPKDFRGKPGNVLVALQMGAEVGLPPMQAIQSIAVINGRPSMWGDALLGLVQASGLLEDIVEDNDGKVATCAVKRYGRATHTQTFSLEDARKAGLIGKQGPWSQYQTRMLQMRARAFALRDVFPDVLKGLHCAEESQDVPTDPVDITPQKGAEPTKGVQGLKDKLQAPAPAPAPDHESAAADWLIQIRDATTADELKKIGEELAAKATAKVQDMVRTAYRERGELLAPAKA